MTCTVERAPLATAVSALAKLSNDRRVRLRIVKGNLCMSATDDRTWLHLTIPANGELDDVCVSGVRLNDVVASFSVELLGFQIDGQTLRIHGGKGKRTLPIMPAEEFPDPEFEGELLLTLDADKLREVLAFTLPHVPSPDDLVLAGCSGVFFFADNGRLKAVGTDKSDLSLIDVVDIESSLPPFIIPKRLAETVVSTVNGGVEISLSERAMEFRWLGGVLRGQLLEDPFPLELLLRGVRAHVAMEGAFPVSVEAKALKAALRGVRALGEVDRGSSGKRVCMTLNGTATLSTASQEGSADEEFAADLSDARELQIGFSSSRMERVLQGFGDRVLNIKMRDAISPMKFEAAGLPDRTALLFPMRI